MGQSLSHARLPPIHRYTYRILTMIAGDTEQKVPAEIEKPSCSRLLQAESRLSFFSIQQSNYYDDDDERVIDVPQSFAPHTKFSVCSKGLIFTWSIQVLIQTIVMEDSPRRFFLAYLTHWTLVVSLAYLLASLLLSTCFCCTPHQPHCLLNNPQDDGIVLSLPHWSVRLTWGLFSIAATAQMNITFLFWMVEYDPDFYSVTYTTIMRHGGIMILVILEGLVINRIPVRLKQMVLPVVFSATYMLWTLIHDFCTTIGNPQRHDNDPATDDDAIYHSLSWENRPGSSLLMALFGVLVLVPSLYLLLWCMSMCGSWYCRLEIAGIGRRRKLRLAK
jgi:hypothetical protein